MTQLTRNITSSWQKRVGHAFSRAAGHYERQAVAQHAMGEVLWAHLPEHAECILDLGCGPGHWSVRLAGDYGPACRVIGLDLAPGMLHVARRRHEQAHPHVHWLCADAAALPLADSRFDLVFSNLAIQWCRSLESVLSELRRVLRPGGRAVINTLGPGTLAEVGYAWSRPTQPAALLGFQSPERHLTAARLAGFERVTLTATLQHFHYPDLRAVMASIKGIGAQTSRPGARLSRFDLAHAKQRYERLRDRDGLPVSYQLLTLILER